jgi:hypothetical protein
MKPINYVIPLLSVIISLFSSGCLGPRFQENYSARETVAVVTSGDFEHSISKIVSGKVYWMPIQDVTRVHFKTFVVEIKSDNVFTGSHSIARVELMTQAGLKPEIPPFFMGASRGYSFWCVEDSYFAIDSKTASIVRIYCDRRFLYSAVSTEIVDERTIRRKSEGIIYELSVDGVREVGKY